MNSGADTFYWGAKQYVKCAQKPSESKVLHCFCCCFFKRLLQLLWLSGKVNVSKMWRKVYFILKRLNCLPKLYRFSTDMFTSLLLFITLEFCGLGFQTIVHFRRRGLEFLSLTGKVEGKRDRGKQRITFLDSLCNSATGGQSKGLNFLKLSDDRDVWRGMVANVCSRSGT